MDDLAKQLASLQGYAADLHSLLAEAEAHTPRQASGSDQTGAVSVVIDQTGIPLSFTVARDWSRRVSADTFAAAVVESCQVAMGNHLAAWTTALEERDSFGQRAQPAREGRSSSRSNSSLRQGSSLGNSGISEIPPAFRRPAGSAPVRSVSEIAEDAIKAFDTAGEPVSIAGFAGKSGRLSLTLSAQGLQSCEADSRWLGSQTSTMVSNVLNHALAEAREKLNEAAQNSPKANPLDDLLSEVFSLLSPQSHTAPKEEKQR